MHSAFFSPWAPTLHFYRSRRKNTMGENPTSLPETTQLPPLLLPVFPRDRLWKIAFKQSYESRRSLDAEMNVLKGGLFMVQLERSQPEAVGEAAVYHTSAVRHTKYTARKTRSHTRQTTNQRKHPGTNPSSPSTANFNLEERQFQPGWGRRLPVRSWDWKRG